LDDTPVLPDVEDLGIVSENIISELGNEAGSQGDPHFKTWHNEHFEYHGQCDMILAKDPNFADGLGLDIQIRTKLVRFWSYIKTAAIRIGDDIFEVEGFTNPDNDLNYWMNLEKHGELSTIGGFLSIKLACQDTKKSCKIDLSSKYPDTTIELSVWNEFVRVNVQGGSFEAFGNTVGMLGDYKSGKTLSRDGVVIDDFRRFGNE